MMLTPVHRSPYPPRLDAQTRLRISNAIDRLIDLLDQDDAIDPAHECEGQWLWGRERGWLAVCPDLEASTESAVETLPIRRK